jgi:site-specific recombinase XerD
MRHGIQQSGVPPIGFDGLRDAFAGALSARGIDRVQLGELLGHRRARDTARYDRVRAQSLDAAAVVDAAYGPQG